MKNLSYALVLLVAVGCSQKNEKITVAVAAPSDYTPFVVWMASSSEVPTPAPVIPVVVVGDTCPTCKGSGKNNTDGTMVKTCKDCKGDGKVDAGDPILGATEGPQKSIVKIPEESSEPKFYVEHKGKTYYWDGVSFVAPGEAPIIPSKPIDVRRVKSISLCQGSFCLTIPIKQQ